MIKCVIILLLLILGLYAQSYAQEFRKIRPILTPVKGKILGKATSRKYRPVSRENIKKALNEMFNTWNKGDISKYLSDDFYDKSRLMDNMYEKVPRDASIRLLSVGETQTLDQREVSCGSEKEIISTVSVTATTQIEFNDPERGYRRLEGQNEYIIRVTEEMR